METRPFTKSVWINVWAKGDGFGRHLVPARLTFTEASTEREGPLRLLAGSRSHIVRRGACNVLPSATRLL